MTRPIRSTARAWLTPLAVATAFLIAACSGSGATAATSAPAAATSAPAAATPAASGSVYEVKVAQDAKLGSYLTGEDGKSLYLLTSDTSDTSTCSGACATAWPPFELTGSETVAAGDGVAGTLATITRADDGKAQVTYKGIPLYYFAKDTKAGDINGQGVKGVWFLVAPASTAAGGPITGGVGQGAGTGAGTGAGAAATPTTGGRYGSGTDSGGAAGSVQIAGFAFAPANLTVPVGSTVTWTNGDSTTHTVTADDGSFDSGQLAQGATFSQVFATAGTFTYHCAIHSSMKATITVTG